MKAVLVIDMPKSCSDCKLADFGRCWGTYSYVHMRRDDIPVNCPLKPIPKKKNEEIVIKGHTGEIAEAYQSGWNDCIDEITGETE